MLKKSLAVIAAVSALSLGASTAQAAPTADASVAIRSKVPVPGGLTAGSWAVMNGSTGTLAPGTTFIIEFSPMATSSGTGVTTVTTLENDVDSVTKLTRNRYRITIKTPMGPGTSATGYWSDSHLFSFSQRDKVTVSLESTNGVTDTDDSNNVQVYDNGGRGF